MRNLITSVTIALAGFAGGIAMVLSCSQDSGVGAGLETIGLEETTAAAEPGLEETCTAWQVRSHDLSQQLGETFNVPSGEFPFAVITGGSYYLFTRTCAD